jgi:hypothetical protein
MDKELEMESAGTESAGDKRLQVDLEKRVKSIISNEILKFDHEHKSFPQYLRSRESGMTTFSPPDSEKYSKYKEYQMKMKALIQEKDFDQLLVLKEDIVTVMNSSKIDIKLYLSKRILCLREF